MDKTSQKPEGKSGIVIAALVIGIIGLCLSAVPIVNNFAAILGVIALILSIIGLVKKAKKGLAIASLIISVVTIAIVLISQAMYGKALDSVSNSINKTEKDNNTPVSVVYEISGSSTSADITYDTYTNGNSGSEQANDQKLPFTKTVTGTKGWSGYFISASNTNGDSSSISCKITVDGKVVSNHTSSGSFANVSCSAN